MIVQATERGVLERLGLDRINNSGACGASWIDNPTGGELASLNPSTGEEIARVLMASEADYEVVMAEACDTFNRWRMCPAPKRGEIVREIGERAARSTRTTSARSSPSKWARSSPKASAKCRR